MTHKINNVRIYVEKDSGWQYRPRKGTVELLDTDYSIIHTAGRPSYSRSITFVVFSGYATDILPVANMTSVNYEDIEGTVTAVSVMDFKSEKLYDYFGRDIYRVSMELLKDD